MDFDDFENQLESLVDDVDVLRDSPEFNDVVGPYGKACMTRLKKRLAEAQAELLRFRKSEGL